MAILRDNWIVIAIGVAVIAALTLLIWLWWQVPKWQMQDRIFKSEKERADAEDNFRKTVGQALGGAAVLIGAGVAYLQFSQQQQTAHDQLQAATDLRISNQVSKGFEQLAGTETAMRLGGIYALEGVMNAPSSQYRVPVLEALCAFVRDSTTRHQVTLTTFLAALFPAAHDKPVGNVNDAPATDVQAALTVIGRRNPGLGSVNLTGANIPGADLFGAHLEGAALSEAHLERATRRISKAPSSARRISKAPSSSGRISKAPPSARRISKAPSSSGRISNAPTSTRLTG